ncbi:hypothetical protein Y032_0050g1934 [Ancylostoma ceylanicum]|nr:hypothetical protein Y032_0050g1934 [Ancylostoma ceylanicum]
MSPGLTFLLQVIMVGIIVLDVVLGIVGMVIYAVQSKKISKKLRLRPGASGQAGQKDGEGEAETPAVFGPEEEEDPIFGYVGMPRKNTAKQKQKFVVIPPAVPRKK